MSEYLVYNDYNVRWRLIGGGWPSVEQLPRLEKGRWAKTKAALAENCFVTVAYADNEVSIAWLTACLPISPCAVKSDAFD